MKFPKFCYEKAFWIVIGFLITATGSAYAAIDAEINSVDERLRNVETQVAENNVPELKQYLSSKFSEQKRELSELGNKIDQRTTENQNLIYQNYRILCQLSEGRC